MVTYALCKVMFKGDASDLPSSSAAAPAGGGGSGGSGGGGCEGGGGSGGGGCDVRGGDGDGGGNRGGGGGSGGGCDGGGGGGDGGCDGGGGSGGGGEVEHTHSLITPMNNRGGGMSAEAEAETERSSSELHNLRQFSGFLHLEEETQMEDAIRRAINNLSPHDLNCLLNNDYDDEEQGNTQE
ncbi:hypothetical protein BRARA_J00087 [Brassica rapa]|uniref:NAC domain-containing protein n=2 Tax=Brassica campestris TaxID=3711 RepID=A0A397XL20_BRACM|nr:hypothetical protein BRARA_J00087 [Brassica rapa]